MKTLETLGISEEKIYSVFVGWLFLVPYSPRRLQHDSLVRPERTDRRVGAFVIIAAIALMRSSSFPFSSWLSGFPEIQSFQYESTYLPKWGYSAKIDLVMWAVPFAIVTVLAMLAWTRTHALDPYKPIASAETPINIEAVSLDWKWLFIYPDQNIATVNQITFPVNVPLSFKLTSDTVMTSFFIPQLGSQIYAMGGMQTRLHLLANKPGTYAGQNNQLSGRGYADMHFKAHAVSREKFQAWV